MADWLSKDERRLLAGYYRNLRAVDKPVTYKYRQLAKLLSIRKKYILAFDGELPQKQSTTLKEMSDAANHSAVITQSEIPKILKKVSKDADGSQRVEQANALLEKRQFIKVQKHLHAVVTITLKLDGYDLGKVYDSWFDCTQILFEKYRKHWLVLFLTSSFVGGAILFKGLPWFWHKFIARD